MSEKLSEEVGESEESAENPPSVHGAAHISDWKRIGADLYLNRFSAFDLNTIILLSESDVTTVTPRKVA
ncbi:unnamed protein product, partial [Mesorhabditis belari]|uniref:Uncharacterized protein n=1 Tax=Mesorhabditis belari TaxID=2138241 RepID=A0AAF3F880_9BILA